MPIAPDVDPATEDMGMRRAHAHILKAQPSSFPRDRSSPDHYAGGKDTAIDYALSASMTEFR
jgi:hypothetical protein